MSRSTLVRALALAAVTMLTASSATSGARILRKTL